MGELDDSLVSELHEARRRFLALVADVRPELHRYCARMTGSVIDGEDIVQETLARAYYALSEMASPPALRPWLFHIAHNRALDHLRRYDRKMGQALELVPELRDDASDPEDALSHEEAMREALSAFLELPPAPRSAVILKDVLGHTVEAIAALLELSVPSVKSLIFRGRARLRARRTADGAKLEPPPVRAASAATARYAALFNARDWDGVRAMLAEDVRLDLVSKSQRAGRRVGGYFTNYAHATDWHLVPAWLEGREVLAVFRDERDPRPSYVIALTLDGDRVAAIRDFRYVPYIAKEARIALAPAT